MKKIVIVVVSVLVLIFFAANMYAFVNGLRTESINQERGLNVQYLDNQNMLSEFVSGFYEQVGIANLKSEKMDAILIDAVKGRYDKEGFSAKGAFFAAVVEAYPDISGLNIYDKIVDYIKAKRAEYRALQTKLLSMLGTYDTWRESGYVRGFIIASLIGVPTDRLEARISDTVLYGKAAREKMYQIVLTDTAVDAYKTSRMAPLSVEKK